MPQRTITTMNAHTAAEMAPLLLPYPPPPGPGAAWRSLTKAIDEIQKNTLDLENFKKVFTDHPNPHEEIKNNNLLFTVVSGSKRKAFDILHVLLPIIDSDVLSAVDKNGKTVLHVAVENDHGRCTDAIIRTDSESLTRGDRDGNTPLHYMVRLERTKSIQKAFDVILKEDDESTPAGSNGRDSPQHSRLETSESRKRAINFCSRIINLTNKNSMSALHLAARERSPEIMKIFLDNGGDPKALTNQQYTPLHFAAQSGSLQCVRYLLAKLSLPKDRIEYLNKQTDIGFTALMLAAKQGYVAICRELRQTDLSLESKDGNTALNHAAVKGSIRVVDLLTGFCEAQHETLGQEKANLISFKNTNFISSCLTSTIYGKSDACFAYFLNKAEVQLPDAKVEKLVAKAANTSLKCVKQMAGRPEFNKHLVEFRTESGDSLLHLAVAMKSYVTAKQLLADTNIDKFARNKNEDSALHLMARQPEICVNCHGRERQYVTQELLMNSRELVKSANKAGETPLHLAARSGNADLLRAFLHKEPNVFSMTKKGMTAVHFAAEMGHTRCLQLLLQSLKAQDHRQLRDLKPHPLHLCAGNGHMGCCELLLTTALVGENPEENLTLRAYDRQYPIDRAFRAKHAEVFSFLLGKMRFKDDEEFAVRLHRYMKKCLTIVSKQRDPRCGDFYASAIEAMIQSAWSKAVLDGRYCRPMPQHPCNVKKTKQKGSGVDADDTITQKPCESFAMLIKTHSGLACKAMDQHISVLPDSACEVHDYTLFEYIYHCSEGEKKVSPFEGGDNPGVEGTNPGAAGANPGAAGSNPGAAGANPGAAGSNPGAAGANPGAAGANPGSAGANPGSAGANPGTAGANPGAAGANPGAAGSNPGAAGANPGAAGANPGAAGRKARPRRAPKRVAPSHNATTVDATMRDSTESVTGPAGRHGGKWTNANATNAAGKSTSANPSTANPAGSSISARPDEVSPTQALKNAKVRYERRLKANVEEFKSKSWCKDHPLQEAVNGGHTQVLRHKLVQSWLLKKFRYARRVLYPYLLLDVVTAAVVYWLQALLWNTHQLEARFSGATRGQLSEVYGRRGHNGSVQVLYWSVAPTAAHDLSCVTWAGDPLDQDPLEPGSTSWMRSLCALYHLEQKPPLVVLMEVVVLVLMFIHLFVEFKFLHATALAAWDVHRVSRLCLRLPFMGVLVLGTSLCDLKLGTRDVIIWQLGVVTVLLCWIHVVLTLNKVPRFSGFMPVTPMLLLRYVFAVVPLLLFLWAFALAFHLLFSDALSFRTVPYSLIKTVTWLLGDLGYDDSFQNEDSPLAYPLLSNILFVVFIICIGGLVLNYIIGHPTEKLFDLRKEDDLNRAVAHLHIHLIIDECVPDWRRKYARSHGVTTDTKPTSLYVSSEMLQPNLQKEETESRDVERLVEEVAHLKDKVNAILEAIVVLNPPKFHRHDQSADSCSAFPDQSYVGLQNTYDG